LSVDSDLAFFYDYSEFLGRPKNEEYIINFTGPGSITVDEAGIAVYRQDSDSIWTGGAPVSYLDLWNAGILQANGLSGKTGTVPNGGNSNVTLTPATFSDYFTTENNPGDENYRLISLIEALEEEDADFNEDGTIDAADEVARKKFPGLFGPRALWVEQFGQPSPGSGGSGGVPEPGTIVLMLLGVASISMSSRRSR
jgi:hypothetical protein